MKLKVQLPTEMIVDEEVSKVTGEALDGSFTLLPRHIDFVTALVPGILSFATAEEDEALLAIDDAVLVKCGGDVLVAARRAVRGRDLESLQETVREEFASLGDHERKSRSAALKLEADLVRRFLEIQESGG